MHSLKQALGLGALWLVGVGCAAAPGSDAAKTGAEAEQALEAFERSHERSLRGSGDTAISIDPRIASECDLPVAHFAFDSANIHLGEAPALDALAHCFTAGPMKGEGLMLVGHADPRGELQYNFGLGQARAGSVARYLTLHGLGEERIATSSLGELEATGTDAPSWKRDRRVEVLLADH
jgi:peptidoglycan-associated lipoprotein